MSILRSGLLLLALMLSSRAMALGVDNTAPNLSALSSDGRMLSLDQYKGKLVYLDFWASWCAPCRQAMPVMDAMYQRYQAQGLVVIGVNVDTERKSAQRVLDQLHPTFPVVFDPDGKWPQAFGLRDMPTSYLIDAKGVIRYVRKGYRERDEKQLEDVIKTVLGEKS
jgi:thiol-disulfide isomerase/thioredoxin